MKILKSLNLFAIVLFGLVLFTTSCKKNEVEEDLEYHVNVKIISPDEGVTLSVGQKFTVEVDYIRNDNIIHNILVDIVDSNGNTVKKLVERHAHVPNEFTFKQEGIVIDQAGTYKIKAMTTNLGDEDKEVIESNISIHTFIIQ